MRYRSSISKKTLRTLEQVLEGMADGRIPDDLQIAGKNPAAVALGRMGGLKGGNARAASLTAERRADIARKAATARWSKKG
jgi:hypothetical protein